MSLRPTETWTDDDLGVSPRSTPPPHERAPLLGRTESNGDGFSQLRRRRSSVTDAIAGLTDIGGANSIRSFSRSFQRAAGFPEIIPQRPSFVYDPSQRPLHEGGDSDAESAIDDTEREDAGPYSPKLPSADDRLLERKRSGASLQRAVSPAGSAHSNSLRQFPSLFEPPRFGSYGSARTYGSIGDVESDACHDTMVDAPEYWRQHRESVATLAAEADGPAILVREVEQDGKIVLAVSGQSTLPQTIVNSTNVLIGIGLLSLPMGLKYAGWIVGLIVLALCGGVTSWTAILLSRCMDLDPAIITFSDIAFVSFGRKARIATACLFTLELMAACVALIVLFADSLTLLFPGTLTLTQFKILCTLVLIPLQFAPLALLSVTSFVGIFCCLGIGIIVVLDGLLKNTSPGSLIVPAATHLFPSNWLTLPLSFGLLMSPWGGHSVFPNIYRDMRHPQKYKKAVRFTFSFTMVVDATVAIVGFLMFGDTVREEITANILESTGYPHILNILIMIFIAVIPLTKVPLTAQPIVTTIEVLFGLRTGENGGGVTRAVIRVGTLLVFLVISILFPAFDSIMAFMGSALCFTICVTLPVAFYLRLFYREISLGERLLCWSVMFCSISIAIIGTVWAFLPKYLIGADS